MLKDEKRIRELEDLEDIRLFDKAKASKEPSIPIDEAFEIIEAKRRITKATNNNSPR